MRLVNAMFPRENEREYVLKYFATILQKRIKTGVCMILYSNEGTGKDLLISLFQNIMGECYCQKISSSKDLYSDFNAHLRNLVLCGINEASHKEHKENHNHLKTIITDKGRLVNEK